MAIVIAAYSVMSFRLHDCVCIAHKLFIICKFYECYRNL